MWALELNILAMRATFWLDRPKGVAYPLDFIQNFLQFVDVRIVPLLIFKIQTSNVVRLYEQSFLFEMQAELLLFSNEI